MATNSFLFDASALTKQYAAEQGSALIQYVFSHVARERCSCLLLGVGEVIAALVHKKNRKELTPDALAAATSQLAVDVMDPPEFLKLEATRDDVVASWDLIDRHSLNATDCLLLRVALDWAQALRADGDDLVLVASDHRLIDAAKAEGLDVFDPENDPQTKLDQLVGE